MMKKPMTESQQQLVDEGANTRTITIRYESSRYGDKTRRETVKATMPDLGDGHATFRVGRDTYVIADNALYRAQTRNINEPGWNLQADELHETFYMGAKDKADAVSETYDYVPTTEEMDAADALNGAFRGVEGGYGEVNSLATARRIAEALAAYDAARENVTIL